MFQEFYNFASKLEKKANECPKFLEKLNKQIADEFKSFAEPITPVRTGNMKASWEVQGTGFKIDLINKMYYSGFVDLGTRKMAPRLISMRAAHMVDVSTIPKIERRIYDWLQYR